MGVRIFCLLLFLSHSVLGQQVYKLYDGQAPGSEEWDWQEAENDQNFFGTRVVYNVVEPTITAYLPPYYLATGTAVIIAPGGGFHTLSMDSEGIDLAKWLNSKGVAAFVLKYRLVRSHTDDPVKEMMLKSDARADMDPIIPLAIQDGLTAIKYVRDHAAEMEIDPERIGLMGFSAGGTLTIGAAYHATEESRPNFVAPIYAFTSPELGGQIPEQKTPIFLTVAGDDQLQLTPHSVDIYQQWVEAGHPAELHIYEKGGHGFGMRTNNVPTDTWYERFGDWLHLHGYLKKLYPNKYEKLYGQDAVARGKIERVKQMQTDYAQLARYREANKALSVPTMEEKRVVFLGNSITEGWVNVDPDFFSTNNFVGRGISGQTSPQLLLRFRQDVLELNPEAVVIHIGTNDVAENTGPYDPMYTMSNIASMVELAEANDIKVILASVLPATKFEWIRKLGDRSDMIVDLNDRIEKYAAEKEIPFVDYHTAMKNDQNGMDPIIAEDGVHPTEEGYRIMQSIILPVIKNLPD